MGGLQVDVAYHALTLHGGNIYAVRGSSTYQGVHAVAWHEDGTQLFDVDVLAALGTLAPTGEMVVGLTVADDGTALVILNRASAYDGVLVSIRPDGTVAWTQRPLAPWFGQNAPYIPPPVIAPDGTIYLLENYYTDLALPPRLTAHAPDGTRLWFHDFGDSCEFALDAFLEPDGNLRVFVDGCHTLLERIDTTSHQLVDTVTLFKGFNELESVLPMPDGTIVANGYNPNQLAADCGPSSRAQRVMMGFSPAGALQWTTPFEAAETSSRAVTGNGDDLLVTWGNCGDGMGNGVHIFHRDGTLATTWRGAQGDAVATVGTSGNDVYVLVQNDTLPGQDDSGPVVHAVDRTTGQSHQTTNLRCGTSYANHVTTNAMAVLPNGHLVVACQESAEVPGAGGIYVLDTAITVASSLWPYADGDAASTHRLAQ